MDNNGTTNVRDRKTLSHQEFYRLCNALAAHEEEFLRDCPSLRAVANILSKEIGFNVSEHSISQAKEATGLIWKAKTGAAVTNPKDRDRCHRANTNALVELYRRLGEPIPSYLAHQFESLNGHQLPKDVKVQP